MCKMNGLISVYNSVPSNFYCIVQKCFRIYQVYYLTAISYILLHIRLCRRASTSTSERNNIRNAFKMHYLLRKTCSNIEFIPLFCSLPSSGYGKLHFIIGIVCTNSITDSDRIFIKF